MRLSPTHELALYEAMLTVLYDMFRGHSQEVGDLFALYEAVQHHPTRAIEELEAIAQDEARHASVRSTAAMVASWERELVAASDRREEGDG